MTELLRSLVGMLAGEASRRTRQALMQSALFALVVLAAATSATAGVVCLLVVLWIVSVPYVGAAGAWLIVAAVLFVFSAAMLIRARAFGRPRVGARSVVRPAASTAEASESGPSRQTATALLFALAIGLIAGAVGK